ncbi:MAG: redoxin domain-containing protein [Rhizobiales bacterium]|nr:redoxin domain-containing protein [Hyphomicrobiales bacterium]
MIGRGIGIAITIAAFALGAAVALWQFGPSVFHPAARSGGQVSVGTALVGGPFTLTAHDGRQVSERDLVGRYTLIYFGFTHCPDVCPSGLQTIAAALDEAGPAGEKVTPWFITVDPERDTAEQLADYVSLFHPRLVGLTGTPEQIKATTKAYKVYAARVDDPSSAGAYTMDHSSIAYLMDKDGRYAAHFSHGTGASEMAARLRTLVK